MVFQLGAVRHRLIRRCRGAEPAPFVVRLRMGRPAGTHRGSVFYVLAHDGDFTRATRSGRRSDITGGDQKGFPGNRNERRRTLANAPGETGTAPDETFMLDIQGGAFMVNAYARFLRITNNNVVANSGASAAIRIGTPQLGTAPKMATRDDPATGELVPAYDQQNTDLRLAYNRITANGGTSFGGALAIFNGSERYRVDHNEFCGNYRRYRAREANPESKTIARYCLWLNSNTGIPTRSTKANF